jgi:hypothetical protein
MEFSTISPCPFGWTDGRLLEIYHDTGLPLSYHSILLNLQVVQLQIKCTDTGISKAVTEQSVQRPRYSMGSQGNKVRFPVEAGKCFPHHRVQNSCGAHPASYPKITIVSFLGSKAAGPWSYKSIPQYAFIVWCSVKKRAETTLPSSFTASYQTFVTDCVLRGTGHKGSGSI